MVKRTKCPNPPGVGSTQGRHSPLSFRDRVVLFQCVSFPAQPLAESRPSQRSTRNEFERKHPRNSLKPSPESAAYAPIGRQYSGRSKVRWGPTAGGVGHILAIWGGNGSPLFLAEGGLAREFHAALIVNQEYLHAHHVAELHHVADLLDVPVGELGDVAQAVLPGDDFDEGAKVLDGGDAAGVDGSDFDFRTEFFDFFEGLFGFAFADGGDEDRAVLLDLDGRAGGFLDGADGLAAGTDEFADFFGVDVGGEEAGGVLADAGRGGWGWRPRSCR